MSLAGLSSLAICLWVRQGAQPRVVLHLGRLSLTCKHYTRLEEFARGANALAYYEDP
jgi:hypothetical protein